MNIHEQLDRLAKDFITGKLPDSKLNPDLVIIYQHKYIPGMFCERLSPTARGWKVSQSEDRGRRKPKVTIQYYNNIDFDIDKGYWIRKK